VPNSWVAVKSRYSNRKEPASVNRTTYWPKKIRDTLSIRGASGKSKLAPHFQEPEEESKSMPGAKSVEQKRPIQKKHTERASNPFATRDSAGGHAIMSKLNNRPITSRTGRTAINLWGGPSAWYGPDFQNDVENASGRQYGRRRCAHRSE